MAKDPSFDYTVHAVAKADGRAQWTRIGVAFINDRPGEDNKPVQTVSIKLNAGISINCSECDLVLLPPQAKDSAA
ncbi:MAG: hypothetical protein ABL901_10035 [Hyphomicrobiaceae bacterium]